MARHWLIHSSLVVVVALVCLTVGFQAGAQETPDKGRPNSLKVGQVQKVGGKIITAEDLIARIWEYESMLKPDQRVLEPTMSYLRDTALLDLDKVLALVTTDGGPTSHTAILAREKSIPAVVGVAAAKRDMARASRVYGRYCAAPTNGGSGG